MPMATDYWVSSRDEAEIANRAALWRAQAESKFGCDYFNIVDFIKEVLQRRPGQREQLRIKFLDRKDAQLAKVTYNPLTLWVRVDIWADARERDLPFARFVLGHECGHIVLHDHYGKAFSDGTQKRIPESEQDRSAEWQADRFADHFLMPTSIVERHNSAADVAARCGVELHRAVSRLEAVEEYWLRTGVPCTCQCDVCMAYPSLRIGERFWCKHCQKAIREQFESIRP